MSIKRRIGNLENEIGAGPVCEECGYRLLVGKFLEGERGIVMLPDGYPVGFDLDGLDESERAEAERVWAQAAAYESEHCRTCGQWDGQVVLRMEKRE